MQRAIIYDDFTGNEISVEDAKQVSMTINDSKSFTLDVSEAGFAALLDMIEGNYESFREYMELAIALKNLERKAPTGTDVRVWAAEQGMIINQRGPVPASIKSAYSKALGVTMGRGADSSLCIIHSGLTHDVFYVVSGEMGVKLGVTNGDAQSRLRQHELIGYKEILFLRQGLNPGLACMAEQRIIDELRTESNLYPENGREYFDKEATQIILCKANKYLPEVEFSEFVSNNEVRDWANTKGFNLGARGPIPREVIAAYQSELTAPSHLNGKSVEMKTETP
jgi:hypothetical protein